MFQAAVYDFDKNALKSENDRRRNLKTRKNHLKPPENRHFYVRPLWQRLEIN